MKHCIVKDCQNTSDQGTFVGDVCGPCYEFMRTGHGADSQLFRNADSLLKRRLREMSSTAQIALRTASVALRDFDKYAADQDIPQDAGSDAQAIDAKLLAESVKPFLIFLDEALQPFVSFLITVEAYSLRHVKDSEIIYEFCSKQITYGMLRRLREIREPLRASVELAKKFTTI